MCIYKHFNEIKLCIIKRTNLFYLIILFRLTNSSFHGIPKQPVKLGPRIQLRFMGSYMAVTYFTLYLFFMTILLGKSLATAVILIVFGFMCYFAFKAVFSPSQECKPENMNNSSFFSESFS